MFLLAFNFYFSTFQYWKYLISISFIQVLILKASFNDFKILNTEEKSYHSAQYFIKSLQTFFPLKTEKFIPLQTELKPDFPSKILTIFYFPTPGGT